MPLSFASWSALLNNFVIEVASFAGKETGWLHTVREMPGFLAIGVIRVLLVMHEQVLAPALLGAATVVMGWFTGFQGLPVKAEKGATVQAALADWPAQFKLPSDRRLAVDIDPQSFL